MKHFVKAVIGLFSVLAFFVVCVFLINAFDENLTPEAKKSLEPFPTVPGYPLKNFKTARLSDTAKDPLKTPLVTYQDYKNSSAGYDETLPNYAASMKAFQEALAAGAPEQKSEAQFKDNLVFYPVELQPVFLIQVSQLLKAGNYSDAFGLLEKSNLFLRNLIQSPQALVNTQIGLAALKKNAVFFESLLKEDFAPSIPETLRQSFVLEKSADEIYALALKKESAIATTFVMNSDPDEIALANFGETSDISASPTKKPASSPVAGRLVSSLFRKKQTVNWFAAIHGELLTEICKEQKEITCSETYKREIAHTGVKYYLINPVGRGLVEVFIPRSLSQREKIAALLKEIKDLASSDLKQ